MSQANELLNTLTEEQIVSYSAGSGETEAHIVIGMDRYIVVPEALRRIAVQFDHNAETVTFDCPRYWDGTDMSVLPIYIYYKLPDKTPGSYPVTDAVADADNPEIMHFTWKISRNMTQLNGAIKISVCVKDTDADGIETFHWNTEPNTQMYVSEGMECNEEIAAAYPDIINHVLRQVQALAYIPKATAEDEGKFLRVIDGEWTPYKLTDMSQEGA